MQVGFPDRSVPGRSKLYTVAGGINVIAFRAVPGNAYLDRLGVSFNDFLINARSVSENVKDSSFSLTVIARTRWREPRLGTDRLCIGGVARSIGALV